MPAPFQMLETLSKIFNGNVVKGRQRILDLDLDFRQRFQHWERCRDFCIRSQAEYFEGD
jgi:hypothetical protein